MDEPQWKEHLTEVEKYCRYTENNLAGISRVLATLKAWQPPKPKPTIHVLFWPTVTDLDGTVCDMTMPEVVATMKKFHGVTNSCYIAKGVAQAADFYRTLIGANTTGVTVGAWVVAAQLMQHDGAAWNDAVMMRVLGMLVEQAHKVTGGRVYIDCETSIESVRDGSAECDFDALSGYISEWPRVPIGWYPTIAQKPRDADWLAAIRNGSQATDALINHVEFNRPSEVGTAATIAETESLHDIVGVAPTPHLLVYSLWAGKHAKGLKWAWDNNPCGEPIMVLASHGLIDECAAELTEAYGVK